MQKKSPQFFSVKLTLNNKVYETKDKTILGAIKKLKPINFKGMGHFEFMNKEKTSKFPIKFNQTKMIRLFSKDLEKELLAKKVSILL